MWGTARTLASNLVDGVSDGFTVNLEINGVGYRAAGRRQDAEAAARLQPRRRGADPGRHQDQGREADRDRDHRRRQAAGRPGRGRDPRLRPPEPYKGKGIKYSTETILRKEGKKK